MIIVKEGQKFKIMPSNDMTNQEALLSHMYDTFEKVKKEINRQLRKWGDQFHTPEVWNAITDEEYGEMVKAMNQAAFNDARLRNTYGSIDNIPDVEDVMRTELWDEAIKEGEEMIACAIQQIHEFYRRRDGEFDESEYTSQG